MSRTGRDYENYVQYCEQEDIRREQAVAVVSVQEFLEHIGFTMVPHEVVGDKQ